MIEVGKTVPRRRNVLLKGIGTAVLGLAGWRITGRIVDEPKFVLTGGPHTSNWDFIFALMSVWVLELDVHWIGKHTIFKWPFEGLFRYFGGIPVDRKNPGTLLRDVLQGFAGNDGFVLALSPEGTRSKVKRLKPGFHRIASKAGVPIVPAGVDFANKTLHFGEVIIPGDDFQADAARLRTFWEGFQPRFPEQF
jgi:1-acyl-sn-glycerol-3-phosphate acyltransferase